MVGPVDVSVRGVFFPFPLDPRAIVIALSIITCCLADKNWNKALIEADESLMALLSKYGTSILQFANALIIVMIMMILDAVKIAWRKERKLERNFHTLSALAWFAYSSAHGVIGSLFEPFTRTAQILDELARLWTRPIDSTKIYSSEGAIRSKIDIEIRPALEMVRDIWIGQGPVQSIV